MVLLEPDSRFEVSYLSSGRNATLGPARPKQPKQASSSLEMPKTLSRFLLEALPAASGDGKSWRCNPHLKHGARRACSYCMLSLCLVSKLRDAVQRVPESSGDVKMLLCDKYQAPISTNPRTFAVCRYGEPSALRRRAQMGQTANMNNIQNKLG